MLDPVLSEATRYEREPPTHDELLARATALGERQRRAYDRVTKAAGQHRTVADGLRAELVELKDASTSLTVSAPETGLLGGLLRRLGRAPVARGTVTDGLLQRYDAAAVHLRATGVYADELEVCAHELQGDLDRLHADAEAAARDAARADLRCEALRDALEHGDPDERRRDELSFALRCARSDGVRFRQVARLCRDAAEPTRRLRDAALDLHEDISRFALSASHTLQGAARHVHALGLAAEAPAVVADLHEALHDLGAALHATEAYVARAQSVLHAELPRLLTQMRDDASSRGALLITSELDDADRRLQEDAADEVRGHRDEGA